MLLTELPVESWPAGSIRPVSTENLHVFAVKTPQTALRETARQMVRKALREFLAEHLDCNPAKVPLISQPGKPLSLDSPDQSTGISVSHEPGLSLIAVNFSGPIGIDLLQLPEPADKPDWLAEIPRLADDYLGPETARRIAELTIDDQVPGFSLAWTEREAGLKCLGLGLNEWNAADDQRLKPCRYRTLALPAGFVGSIAVIDDQKL